MKGKIAVIGDVILDVYHYCRNRENPESSAPCYTVEKTEYKPGGAGNVAANLAKLGSNCMLISVVGEDKEGKRLRAILNKKFNIDANLIFDSSRPTIVKERYLSAADGRYHFRADFERKDSIENYHIDQIIKKVKNCSLVIISDYNKGVISKRLIDKIKSKKIRIIADTKANHKDFFKDILMIKPNLKEVREMANIKNELEAGKRLVEDLRTSVMLTRGKEGIVYFDLNGDQYEFKASVPSDKVFDVTGAGDTVLATYAHFLNKGYKTEDCVRLANIAGGISVQYPGCYQVSEKEVIEAAKKI